MANGPPAGGGGGREGAGGGDPGARHPRRELEPNLENRKTITRLIREWKADIVIAHRPWDYHLDHRYVGVLVQDAAYMVAVPHSCPDTPPLKGNPVFLYSYDNFKKPYAFRPDIVVGRSTT